ncbi:MAG: MalY/PatB family protein [Bacteroidota bacterium]
MSTFEVLRNNFFEHDFIKYHPEFLQSMFGTTDIAPFWIADMDFKVAPPILEELQRLVDRGVFSYEFPTKKAFKAISNWFLERHDLQLAEESFIQITGVLTGISLMIQELSKEGDAVLIQTPVYHQFATIVKNTNRKLICNPLKIVDGKYEMDFEDLEEKFKSEAIKIMLLCNPHNPVGRVWSREELQQLLDLAERYKVTIISDEIHADIVYKPAKFNSISLFDQEQHIVIIGSPAKTFGMQGIATGYLYIQNQQLHEKIKKAVTTLYLDHGNALSVYATIAAYSKGQKWLDELLVYLQQILHWIEEFLDKELPEIQLLKPQGTYQIWLDCNKLNVSEEELKTVFFQKAKIGFAPGSWFGVQCGQFMRMNIASPLAVIQSAFQQLKVVIHEH